MIDTFIVSELISQRENNKVHEAQLKHRLSVETSLPKRQKLLEDIEHIVITNIEIEEMLLLAYPEYISTKRLFKDLER